MIDLGISKLALIGVVALVVVGPEKLPRLARTVGTLLGRAQRYVNEVKAEVSRSMELDELRKMKETVEGAVRDVERTVHAASQAAHNGIASLGDDGTGSASSTANSTDSSTSGTSGSTPVIHRAPLRRAPRKNWRIRRSAIPQWYKTRHGVRTHALSGAARVARYRPRRLDT